MMKGLHQRITTQSVVIREYKSPTRAKYQAWMHTIDLAVSGTGFGVGSRFVVWLNQSGSVVRVQKVVPSRLGPPKRRELNRDGPTARKVIETLRAARWHWDRKKRRAPNESAI